MQAIVTIITTTKTYRTILAAHKLPLQNEIIKRRDTYLQKERERVNRSGRKMG